MKIYTLFFVIICLGGLNSTVWGQNLVPNPSFENVIQCPFSLGFEDYVTDWKCARQTPDYYNVCATSSIASIPSNNFGYQHAYSGNAYIGMLTYRSDSSLYTEAASVQLTNPMIIGQMYYVSFRLSLTIDSFTESNSANNKIGIQFSTFDYSQSNPAPINNYAHILTDSIITDTSGWSIIKGSFIADSNYTHLSVGNFFDKGLIDSVVYGPNFGSYYYFDDICVSTDSSLCYQSTGLNFFNHELIGIDIYPNPVTNYLNINHFLSESYDITIYNTLGQKVYAEKNITANDKSINISKLSTGLLLVNINSGNQSFIFKLLKQ